METFYNSIIPKVAKKEAQRFDKEAKVETADFTTGKGFRLSDKKTGEYLGYYEGEYIAVDAEGKRTKVMPKGYKTVTEAAEELGRPLTDLSVIYTGEKGDSIGEREQLSIKLTPKLKAAFLAPTPLFSLESGDNTYPNFQEALDNTEGDSIDIVSNGVVIATMSTTLDERTTQGVINSLIVDGILKPNKVVFNGKTYFQTTGETYSDRKVSEEFFKDKEPISIIAYV